MKRFVLIVMSVLTLVLSACDTSAAPTENLTAEVVEVPKLEMTGCTLPALEGSTVYLSTSSEDCLVFEFEGCIRYEAK